MRQKMGRSSGIYKRSYQTCLGRLVERRPWFRSYLNVFQSDWLLCQHHRRRSTIAHSM
uniref:Uncharacterized protein n=1 Tax=Anopheles albimanus TaxID=7167 RepID=A0A182FYH2_ANOAL